MSDDLVAITIVTFNSARYILGCLESALSQDHAACEVVVVDNASRDATTGILREFESSRRVHISYNSENTGFAAAQNQAMAQLPQAAWFLALNPDVRLAPDFVRQLLSAAARQPKVGSVCGKLLAASADFKTAQMDALPASNALLDSTGIYFTPSLRHFDRGNRMPDRGQYEHSEYVFGGTGAACLYRQEMVEDVSIFGEFFDSDFFAYREDADVAWRAQLFGWKCLYVPAAVGAHVRRVVPENRASLPAMINMHSVKNRWLMRIKNTTPALYRQHWLAITVRDLVVIAGCLLREWSSLRAFPIVARLWGRTLEKRREIMRRKRASDDELASWFVASPASQPVSQHSPQTGAVRQ